MNNRNTNYYSFLYHRVIDSLTPRGGNLLKLNKSKKPPLTIGKYKFNKFININKDYYMYRFALYTGPKGVKVFGKYWYGETKNSAYYWLKNEIIFFTTLQNILNTKKINNIHFSVPKVKAVYEDKKRLVLLTEFIKDQKTKTKEKQLLKLYENTINFISQISPYVRQTNPNALINLRPMVIYLSLPVITLKALLNEPTLWRIIFRCNFEILFNVKNLVEDPNWNHLVHRDLRQSILSKKNGKHYVIDWQTAAFSHPYIELVQLIFIYCEKGKMFDRLYTLPQFRPIFKKQSRLTRYKLLCYYVLLVEISLVKVKTKDEELLFFKHIQNLK